MIRIITYIFILVIGIISSFAQIKSEEILLKNGNIELPGTLSYIKEKTPLIIWVHGSGPIDRNGNQPILNANANYIKQFRDAINKEDLAFFSFDKSSTNPKNLPFFKDATINIFIDDIKKIVEHFKSQNRFSEIILLGHSQGSLIGMMALKNADKFISVAGTSEKLEDVLVSQLAKNNEVMAKMIGEHFSELEQKNSIEKVDPQLANVFAKPNWSFLKSWNQINPSIEAKKIKIPTLIINGTKDLQVQIDNAEKLHKIIPSSKLVIIEGMNHVLKHIEKDEDNTKSYFTPDFPLSTELIETIVSFIKQ